MKKGEYKIQREYITLELGKHCQGEQRGKYFSEHIDFKFLSCNRINTCLHPPSISYF